jgi:hypothetical protein
VDEVQPQHLLSHHDTFGQAAGPGRIQYQPHLILQIYTLFDLKTFRLFYQIRVSQNRLLAFDDTVKRNNRLDKTQLVLHLHHVPYTRLAAKDNCGFGQSQQLLQFVWNSIIKDSHYTLNETNIL